MKNIIIFFFFRWSASIIWLTILPLIVAVMKALTLYYAIVYSLWYCRFYDITYLRAISTIFFNLNTTVPEHEDQPDINYIA